METGMTDYLMLHHPDLLDILPASNYDEMFVVPWATSRSLSLIDHPSPSQPLASYTKNLFAQEKRLANTLIIV